MGALEYLWDNVVVGAQPLPADRTNGWFCEALDGHAQYNGMPNETSDELQFNVGARATLHAT